MAGAPSILLVDDEPDNLLTLEAVLSSLPVDFVRAGSGFEALRQLQRHDFAAILLDVQMPEMDGLETAAIIKRQRRSRDIPIIFVTGRRREPAAVARAYALGAVDYVTRPFDTELLRAKVGALVELHLKDEELCESEGLFRAAFEHAPIGMGLLTPNGRWLDVNRALADMLGRSTEELIEAPPFELGRLAAPGNGADALAELLAGSRRTFTIERRLLAADAATLWARVSVSLVRDSQGEPRHLICQIEDISERKRAELSQRREAEQRIAYLAYHDELTSLPNRAMFREHLDLALARAVRHGSATAVLYLDLDCFKLVNDSLGHAAGDEVLREAAGRLARAVRASDLVARVGGDEFIVLLADLEPDAAADIAQLVASAVHAALGDAFVVSGTEFYVGASIGVAFHRPGGDQQRPDADTLLEHADIAMYDAKQSGTPTEVYTRPAGEPRERLALMTRLRKAVQQLDFVLHWLPIIDLDTQRVCGAEALVRWRDPERGWVMPSEFVTLVEEAGLIDRLGAWVLSEAAAQQRAWQSAGLDLEVTVNMSGRQLWRPGAVEEVLDQITSAGADPRRIMLELTETAAGRGPERAEQTLGALRAAGVRIAIDDFADSPLMALSRMEVDVLKIGGALVRAVERPDGEAMIHALVQLSQNLGIWPVAECIETRAQYEALRDAGCRFGQGHFFGRSLPPADVPDYVRRFTLPREYDPWVAWEASRARELIAA